MSSSEHKQTVVLGREQLFEQVWTTPMIRLAEQYGITGTADFLELICPRSLLL